jgi:hypothetical protein
LEGEEEFIVNVVVVDDADGDFDIVAADSFSMLVVVVEGSWKGTLEENDIRSSISSSAQSSISP